MAEALKLRVEKRDPAKNKGTGTRVSRKLRKAGRIPAVVYGHKLPVAPISMEKTEVAAMMAAASHLAEIELDGTTQTVLIRDIQWDHLGRDILHVDFERVSREELIETQVNIEVRGEAPGVAEGGRLQLLVHELTVKCPAGNIPDVIRIDVSKLGIGEGVHVRDLNLPAGVVAQLEPDVLVLNIAAPTQETEEAEGAEPGATQPEVIKPERKEDSE